MSRFLLVWLCLLGPCYLRAQDTDAMLRRLDQMAHGPERLDLLIKLVDELNWKDLEQAKVYGFEALRLAKQLQDPIGTGFVMIELSHNYDSFMNRDSALYYCEEAIRLFREHDHPEGEAQGYLRLGYIAENDGDFTVATTRLFEALRLFELAETTYGMTKAYIGLGKLYFKMDKFEEGIAITSKAGALIDADSPDELVAYYHLVMGNNYRGARAYSLAIHHYEQCQTLAFSHGYNIDLLYTFTFLGDIYQEMGQFDRSREHYEQAIGYARAYKDKHLETFPFIGSGRLHNKMGQYDQAIAQFEVAMDARTERVHNYYWHEIYQELSIAHAGLGNYQEALEHMQHYAMLRDSFFTDRSDRLMAEMQTQYETKQKEQQLRQKQNELAFTLGIIALLAIGAILLTRGYYRKQRLNRILQERNQEKEFLIKEIHHRVKNNLQVLSSLLNLQSGYIQDPAVLDAVAEGRSRVESMGIIHQKLYTGTNLAAVEMRDYLHDLSEHLLDTFGVDGRVAIASDIDIPPLDVDTAIPLGLIINELITNSLKYAFPGDRHGTIRIKLWMETADQMGLSVSDDGVGTAATVDPSLSTSFGSDLVKILTKKLKGNLHQSKDMGFSTTIYFRNWQQAKVVV